MAKKIVFSNNELNQIKELYLNGVSAPNIAKQFNVSKTKIINTVHELDIPFRNDRFNEETEKEIIRLYNIYHHQEKVAEIIGTTGVSVGRVLRRNNIELIPYGKINTKYTLNENYFDNIDTNDKAYILGLLCADGFLSKEKNHTISISLQEDDYHILDDINTKLESNRPINFLNMKKKKETYKNQYYLTITNKHMWSTLNSLGITPNKSLTLQYPDIKKEYNKSFILGYLDGDGCIHKTLNKVGILGTKSFIEKINSIIFEECGISGKIYNTSSNSITKNLEIYGKYKVPLFLKWLYDGEKMFLKRKKQIYLDKYVNNLIA